jgi:1-deoxy-D-xylulose-5-phosphate synthase
MLRLEDIHSPKDIQKLNSSELTDLCDQLRKKMIDTVSRTGGHLASNLGTVELTVVFWVLTQGLKRVN